MDKLASYYELKMLAENNKNSVSNDRHTWCIFISAD